MSDGIANGRHDNLAPWHDPRHVLLNAREVMRHYGWGKTKGYRNLKDHDLVPLPVMTHPDRWRLARFLRSFDASDAFYAAEPEITADSARRVMARQLYLCRAFAKAAGQSVKTGKFAVLFEERAEVLKPLQPQISYLLDVAEVRDPNMHPFWQQSELTTAVARMEGQGVPIWLQPTQMVELAKATHHEVTHALGKALTRELLRSNSDLRDGSPRHARGPLRVGRGSRLEATRSDLVNMPAPKSPVAQFSNPLQRAALRQTLGMTPTVPRARPPSPPHAATTPQTLPSSEMPYTGRNDRRCRSHE